MQAKMQLYFKSIDMPIALWYNNFDYGWRYNSASGNKLWLQWQLAYYGALPIMAQCLQLCSARSVCRLRSAFRMFRIKIVFKNRTNMILYLKVGFNENV